MPGFSIGSFTPASPVVLAPMAGVTDAAFRTVCRRFGPGLVYVNEMVMASAVLHGNAKTARMTTFAPGDHPRSLQLYGSDPVPVGEAIRKLVGAGAVDHIDLNFGCPAAKVTRKGGGAAVPAKPALLRAIMRAAVAAAAPEAVPVTAKFRIGIDDNLPTSITTGTIAADEGIAAIALHARTVEQHYAGQARWEAIGELKQAVAGIPVLGNGDIWEAADAIAMVRTTGCDGVVIGRGCLGRPWLFGQLIAAFRGQPVPPHPDLGMVREVMAHHARLLVRGTGGEGSASDEPPGGRGQSERSERRPSPTIQFRKHTSWYLTGYPVGSEVRRRLAAVGSLGELDDLLAGLDPAAQLVPGGARIRRGHTNGPIRVALPAGYLDRPDDLTPPDDAHVLALSGG